MTETQLESDHVVCCVSYPGAGCRKFGRLTVNFSRNRVVTVYFNDERLFKLCENGFSIYSVMCRACRICLVSDCTKEMSQ